MRWTTRTRSEKPDSVSSASESKDLSGTGDPESVTFWEEGRTHMEGELDKTYAAFTDAPSFGGIAMHHFDDPAAAPVRMGRRPRRSTTRFLARDLTAMSCQNRAGLAMRDGSGAI